MQKKTTHLSTKKQKKVCESSPSLVHFDMNHLANNPLEAPSPLVYVGLDAIAKSVGAGHLAVRKWIREENFPAKRCSDGIYRADAQAIREWFRPKSV